MNKLVRLALAASAVVMALALAPQSAQSTCTPHSIQFPPGADERVCRGECRLAGCYSYDMIVQWGICYCA